MEIKDDEKDVLTDHDYDGIQELDNDLPPWWKNLFFLTIIFGVVYYIGMQHAGWFYQQEDEYNADWQTHKNIVAKAEKMEPGNSNEGKSSGTSSVAGPSQETLDAGKAIYLQNCAACHLADGGGLVGPNLTDNFWINGDGTLESLKEVIAVGVPEKGMVAWKPILGNKKLEQVSIYVLSLIGTTPAKPKKAEGKEIKLSTETVEVKEEMVVSKEDIAEGKKIYDANCMACHLADGGGIIGPNLTDNFWMHGKGSLEDIISLVTKGVPEKGMIAWGPVLGKKRIKQVSAYIKTLQGTKPAKPKAPEGVEIK